ncbi:MAG: NADH-quinone oxidoreductase subunit J [Candidatus Thermofonsia bacterium]|nr:MAG: NADH-quinone oxidoreductase subunit J [Candidatus Thermofonsia bacterium]
MFEQIVFILVSVFTLGMGLIVVTNRNLFRAALALMGSFLGVAGLYLSLDAGFLAAAQLLVYIGAISILIIFAIMLTRRMMQTTESPFNSQPVIGLFTAVVTFLIIGTVIMQYWPTTPDAAVPFAGRTPVSEAVLANSVAALGRAFVSSNGYVIPFEIASVLLLAALVGAILVAWPKPEDEA